jgi:DNA-binding YbaB/EbfC family protein
MDLMKMMRQAQEMQAKMQAMQDELDQVMVEGVAGAGMVKLTLTAKGDLKGVAIDPSLLVPDEREILEDLLVAAHADARKKGQAAAEERMKALTAGLPLPPGMKLPF